MPNKDINVTEMYCDSIGQSRPWQLPATALSLAFSLIIPGHLFSKYEKQHYNKRKS